MFAEDLIQSALADQDSWFVGDYLLLRENREASPEAVANEIAQRNDLRLERFDDDARHGYRFWRRSHTA
jgi:hypothetical protein